MAVPISTSTSSTLPLFFLHRGTSNPSPAVLSFPSSLRGVSLRSQAAAAPPAETLSDDGIPDAPPEGEGTGIPLPSSIGDDGEQLLYGTAGKEIVTRPCAQLGSSHSDSLDVSQEKIVIINRYGEKLVGVLREAGSKDLVVLCHGFRSSKESRTLLSLADALTSENISIFRFDFSGNGESEVINLSGRFNLERGIGDRFGNDYMERINQHGFIDVEDKTGCIIYRVTKESLMDRLKTDMHSACLSIDPNCRVLTVHGANDDVVPSEDALEFDKYISNHELHIIERANHRYASHQLGLAAILAPKQKIRIKLRSYWVPLIEDSCKKIIEAAKTTNAKTMGPVPLPTKRRVYCVLNSPHVHKDSRFHFEIRTHQRLIDIMYPTAQTIDSLMQLQLPAGVDVEVKL
ncbi:unnamed protein product [Miscanthus lutarioriparius]|uniref:Small ribosomal subunit protein uS10c n=1 Tax=Miscanthus lutarioriparius TaxID=422564 RepID=A0A811MS05_9POAL|nr:unnamed protein product [Miscanthus lutarioriparius]